MSDYGQQFNALATAIESLKIFPETITEFTTFLKQRYLRKHKPSELFWIDRLCGVYEDNCKHYAKFIKRVVATQFLGECLHADESQRGDLIKELKANINAAKKRLDNFLGETNKKEVIEKMDGELSKMEAIQQKKDKSEKYAMKFSEWLKGKVLEQVGEVFAKVIGPLWDMVYTNASMAIKSDYDHEQLQAAVQNIQSCLPKMEESLDSNRRALKRISDVLDVFAVMFDEKDPELVKHMRSLYHLQNNVVDACDQITKLVEALKDQ